MAGKKKEECANPSPNWGGKRKGAGRPSRGEQVRVREILDDAITPEEVMGKLRELIDNGDYRAIDLYMKYRVGTPVQSIDLHTSGSVDVDFSLNNIVTFTDSEEDEQ
jgi:hypothetical protein